MYSNCKYLIHAWQCRGSLEALCLPRSPILLLFLDHSAKTVMWLYTTWLNDRCDNNAENQENGRSSFSEQMLDDIILSLSTRKGPQAVTSSAAV